MVMKRWYVGLGVMLLVIGAIAARFSRTSLSTYYRLKYYVHDVPKHPALGAVAGMIKHNPFFNQRHALLVDMSLPSSANRMSLYDLSHRTVLFQTRVMHGAKSGKVIPTQFSNRLGSNKTALGRYVIVGTYKGHFGLAYRLTGLDNSNSNALARSIVLHRSAYVRANRISRSEGCPAVSSAALAHMKPFLKEGTLVWLYQ